MHILMGARHISSGHCLTNKCTYWMVYVLLLYLYIPKLEHPRNRTNGHCSHPFGVMETEQVFFSVQILRISIFGV